MAYKRKTWKNDSSTPLNADGLNDFDKRVGDEFDAINSVLLQAQEGGWNIEWEKRTLNFSAIGYASTHTKKHMKEPHKAVVFVGLASYGHRKSTISAWTVANNPTLLEMFLHDENGKVVSGEVQIQYLVIYK